MIEKDKYVGESSLSAKVIVFFLLVFTFCNLVCIAVN